MSQTILIETNEDLKKIFSLNLNTFVGTDVVLRTGADDTIQLLKILPQISLIITRAKIGEDETAVKIHQHLKNEGLETTMIILGECHQLANQVLCLQEPGSSCRRNSFLITSW